MEELGIEPAGQISGFSSKYHFRRLEIYASAFVKIPGPFNDVGVSQLSCASIFVFL